MNCTRSRLSMVALIVVSFAASGLAQGLYWESTMTGGPISTRTDQMWVVPKKMKGVTEGTGETFIIRLDKELFITIDPNEKTYSEMTFDDIEKVMNKAGSKINAGMAEMRKKLAEMPEEQRKMVEQMMGSRMAMTATDAKVKVTKTGDTKTISGFPCTKYDVTRDGKEFMTLWITKSVKEFESMRKDWEEFSKRLSAMNPMAGSGIADAYSQIDGFPIQSILAGGMTTTVTKIEEKTAPASAFEVPSGYKKVKPKMMEEMDNMDNE
jgi:Domain of unknown function (DUF4412)